MLHKQDLKYYIRCFKKLRRDRKNEGAPHKPILLLAIIRLIESEELKSNKIYITPELVGNFKSIWSELVITHHHMTFVLPFYHMKSEPFWKLVAKPGCEKWVESNSSMRSFYNLKMAIEYAEIDIKMYEFFTQPETREILKEEILKCYFAKIKNQYGSEGSDPFKILSLQIQESEEVYRNRISKLTKSLNQNDLEEEIFVRNGAFKREIKRIYSNSCAISGLRIDATIDVSMIDACHIVPFAESYNDTITNGIALCPNLHRAFDRGLISIDEEYKVLVSSKFVENKEVNYGIRQFEGKKLFLPNKKTFYPSEKNLFNHRQRFGFKS